MAKRPPEILGCDTFYGDVYLGMDDYEEDVGCQVHCSPCDLDANKPGVGDRGNRWLDPDPSRPSRDARGVFHALRSAEPHLYPPIANFRRGSCWNNAGEECNGKVCHCDPQIEAEWENEHEGPRCMDGTSEGQARTGYFADLTFATGNHLSQYGDWLDCRTERPPQLFDLPVAIMQGPLNQMGTARSGSCTSNLLAWCIGKRYRNACSWVGGQDPYGNEYFNTSQRRVDDWKRMHVHELSPQLLNSRADPILTAKNAALAFAPSIPGPHPGTFAFKQMTHANIETNPNGNLGHWDKGWSVENIAAAPAYMTLPNCRLRFSELPVTAELVILSGHIELDLVLHRVVHAHTHNTSTAHLYPSTRFRMHLELGARAEFTDGSVVTLYDGTPVPLTLHNPLNVDRRYPLLLTQGHDRPPDHLDFIDNQGWVFTPPTSVDWLGSLQELSSGDGVWPDLFAGRDEPGGTIIAYCHEIAKLLNADNMLTVVGVPDVYTCEPNESPTVGPYCPKIRYYGGQVVVHLSTD